MQITRQADYAVRAVLYLAQQPRDTRSSTAQIARDQAIPPTFLAKIVAQLSVAGILQATRGARGGVQLARPPEAISLLEIVEVIDGPLYLNDCVANAATCPHGAYCTVHQVWCEAQADLVKRLGQTHFGQLAQPLATH